MDAFKNYEALMSGIGQNVQQEAENAKQSALFNAKSRADEIVKTIGEAKIFLSGKPLLNRVGKVLKPKLKKFGEEAEEKFGKLFEKPGLEGEGGPPEPPALNSDVTPNDAGPSRLDELRQKVANQERDAQRGKDAEQAEKDAQQSAERRGARDPEATGEEETIEMQDLGGGTGAEIPNKAFDPSAADEEVGETAAGEASGGTDIATGLEGGFNASSDPVFSSVMSQARGGNLQNPFANARQNKFNPDQEDGQSNTTPRSQPAEPETQPTADAPASGTQAGADGAAGAGESVAGEDAADAAAAAAKSAAEATAKAAAKKAAEEAAGKLGGEEAGAGILDAIPGADILGLIAGTIMAAVAARKAHRAEKEEEAEPVAQNNTSFSFQAGVGTD